VRSITAIRNRSAQPRPTPFNKPRFLLIIVGKLFEALEIFRKRFLSHKISRTYLKLFNARQNEAIAKLKAALGKSNLIATIRNDFAFHYHDSRPLSRFMASLKPDRLLTMYLGDPDANTLNAQRREAQQRNEASET
jgi:hypothetical protein